MGLKALYYTVKFIKCIFYLKSSQNEHYQKITPEFQKKILHQNKLNPFFHELFEIPK